MQESPYLQEPRSHQVHIDWDEDELEKWGIDMVVRGEQKHTSG